MRMDVITDTYIYSVKVDTVDLLVLYFLRA